MQVYASRTDARVATSSANACSACACAQAPQEGEGRKRRDSRRQGLYIDCMTRGGGGKEQNDDKGMFVRYPHDISPKLRYNGVVYFPSVIILFALCYFVEFKRILTHACVFLSSRLPLATMRWSTPPPPLQTGGPTPSAHPTLLARESCTVPKHVRPSVRLKNIAC